uniref:BACK domain-containing protein n=1 Tax=Setaria digitata TaxID=48799 RepID=A0A915PFV3_9BILA
MIAEKNGETIINSYCNTYCTAEANGNICDSDDVLCDCIIITDDNDRYRLNSRFIEHRCPYLISSMIPNDITQQYTIHTSVTIDIANEWKLEKVIRCVVQSFVAGMNEENCIAVWRMCAKYLPEKTKKMDVWILLKKWISIDRKKRLPCYRHLLKCIRYKLLSDKEKEEIKKDLLRAKIDIASDSSITWSTCTEPRIQRDLLVAVGGWEKSGPSTCEINGTIIVAGGSDGRIRLRSAEIYDMRKNQWTKIRNMVQRRSDAAACAMDGKMYVAGGYTGETVLQTVEMYIPEMDIWTEIAHMNSPRSGLACVADKDFILIAGGFDGTNRLNSAEILRIGSAHTVNVEPMPSPRSNFAMCKMGNYIYAIGGYNTSVTKSVIRFDGKKWERICDVSVPRSALRVILLKAWPDPVQLLHGKNGNSKNTNSRCQTKSSTESQKTNDSKTFPNNHISN